MINSTAMPFCRCSAVQQIEDLAAQRDIQRRGGLVGQQQLRLAGQRHGNHGALALAARELVRKRLCAPLRLGDAGFRQQVDGNPCMHRP